MDNTTENPRECRICNDDYYEVNDDGVCQGCDDEAARFDAADRASDGRL